MPSRALGALLAVLVALGMVGPEPALAQRARNRPTPERARPEPEVEDEDEEEEAPAPPKAKPSAKPAARAGAKPGADRPFAAAGYLNVPAGNDVRMGDPSGGLSIVAKGGSLIKRQNKALVLDKGRMGISMQGGGKAAIRVGAGPLIAESAGGKFVLERGATTKIQVLEGKVLVTGAGAVRTLSGWQQLEITTAGKVTTGSTPVAQRSEQLKWIDGPPRRTR